MTNATATINSIMQLIGATDPQVRLELEQFFALAVAEITGGVNADMDTLAEVRTAVNLKAPIASPTFTGTVAGITKTMVGLGNVDNTADTAKPVSTAQQTALDLKPTVVAAPAAANSTGVAGTIAYADGFFYVCVDTNTWQKVAIATWA